MYMFMYRYVKLNFPMLSPYDKGQRVHQNDDENRDRDNDDNDDVVS